jgi:siderophore synthetase component
LKWIKLYLSQSINLDEEEKQVWQWALGNGYTSEKLFKLLLECRMDTISRFFSAYFREFYDEINFEPYDKYVNSQIYDYCYEKNYNPEKVVTLNYINSDKQLIFFIEREYSLGKFSITSFPLLVNNAAIIEIKDTTCLIRNIKGLAAFENYDLEQMLQDLRLSNAQFFLSTLLREKNFAMDRVFYIDVMNHKFTSSKELMLSFFEQWCIRGHLLHPIPKCKSHLTIEELTKYLPEAKNSFKLTVIAVPKTIASFKTNLSKSYDEYMKDVFNDEYAELRESFKNSNLEWEDYYIVPTHPWQYSYLMSNNMEEQLGQSAIKVDGNFNIKGSPLIAFRTLHLSNSGSFVKLPINIQITSSKRHLSPRACHHAIYISEILSTIKAEKGVSASFNFNKEELSVHLSYYIGVIYRQGIGSYLEEDEIIMPAAALYELSPINENQYIIDDILKLYLEVNNCIYFKTGIKDFFKCYTQLLISDIIRLLTAYGIGMEGHLQNCMIVLKNFSPSKVILRDGEAINICTERIRDHFPDHKFYPGSWNVDLGPEACQDVVMHSVIHSNIGQMIVHLSQRYGFSEKELWKYVRDILKKQFANFKHTNYYARAVEDEQYFFNEMTNIKCLFKIKIANTSNDFIHSKLKNPLYNI